METFYLVITLVRGRLWMHRLIIFGMRMIMSDSCFCWDIWMASPFTLVLMRLRSKICFYDS